MSDRIENEYFDWLCDQVCRDRFSKEVSYKKLLTRLHDTTFTYIIPRDRNRAEDGKDLRYRFGLCCGIPHAEDYLDGPCTVLEMMVALAIRCEENIMDDPEYGDRAPQWFWGMITNLGLGPMTDSNYSRQYVDDCIWRLLNRQYDPDGKGGLFRVRNCKYDMRKVEIWYQLNYYLDTIM